MRNENPISRAIKGIISFSLMISLAFGGLFTLVPAAQADDPGGGASIDTTSLLDVTPRPIQKGGKVFQRVKVINDGSISLNKVNIRENLRTLEMSSRYEGDAVVRVFNADGSEVSGVPAVSLDGSTLSWSGVLEPGQRAELSYTGTVTQNYEEGQFRSVRTNTTVTVDGHPEIGENWFNGVSDSGQSNRLDRLKVSDPPSGSLVRPGDIISYSLTISNPTDRDAPSAQLVDILRDVTPLADVDRSSLAVSSNLTGSNPPEAVWREIRKGEVGAVDWNGPLKAGETVTVSYQVTVKEDAVGTIRNNLVEGNITEHKVPGYEHAKVSDPAPGTSVKGGQQIKYTVTGKN
ncbi:DUF11 domain-containing protein, partial [Acaricomes phytoseiuli]|uniref:DUF7927 domain-containing protein n=1 Tax=Acaricomes phytoseiuli TaxID=291968 RepID=UPI0012E996DE